MSAPPLDPGIRRAQAQMAGGNPAQPSVSESPPPPQPEQMIRPSVDRISGSSNVQAPPPPQKQGFIQTIEGDIAGIRRYTGPPPASTPTPGGVGPPSPPTAQGLARSSAFIAAGIVPGGDVVAVGARAGEGFLETIGAKIGIGAAYGAATSGIKNPDPTAVLEGAALGGGLFAAAPIVGRVAGGIGERIAQARPPSTVESEFGTYSGIPRGEPGIIESIKSTFVKPPSTPGYQLTDVPGGEAPIRAGSFGEVFAQKKFGIEPTPSPSYEFEYGANKPFQYSAVEARQGTFTRTGPSGGGGYGGGGGGGPSSRVVTEQQSFRTPPGSPFSETERFRTTFEQPSQAQSVGFRGLSLPGLGGLASVRTRARLEVAPSVSTTPGQAQQQGQNVTAGQGQAQVQPQTQGQGSVVVPQTNPTTTPGTSSFSPLRTPGASEFSFPSVSPTGGLGGAFMQGPSMPSDRRRSALRLGFKEKKHPIGDLLGIGVKIPKGFRAKKGRKK